MITNSFSPIWKISLGYASRYFSYRLERVSCPIYKNHINCCGPVYLYDPEFLSLSESELSESKLGAQDPFFQIRVVRVENGVLVLFHIGEKELVILYITGLVWFRLVWLYIREQCKSMLKCLQMKWLSTLNIGLSYTKW